MGYGSSRVPTRAPVSRQATGRILHVDAGGTFGGSLQALGTYLQHANRDRFTHDLLLYEVTPGAERLLPLVDRLVALRQHEPGGAEARRAGRGRLQAFRGSGAWRLLVEMRRYGAALYSLPFTQTLYRFCRAGGYDLIHVNNTFSYQVPTLLAARDRKSTRLNSSHQKISYDVFCLKKKTELQSQFCTSYAVFCVKKKKRGSEDD